MDNFFFALTISGLLIILGLSRQFRATRYLFISKSAIEHIDRSHITKYLRDIGIMEIISGLLSAALLYVTYEIFMLSIYMLIWVPALIVAFATSFYINKKYMGYIKKLELIFCIVFIVVVGVTIICFCH